MTDIDLKIEIEGLKEAQAANVRRIQALKPSGKLGGVVRDALVWAHRYLVSITHVDTGAYQASQRVEVEGAEGRLFVDPNARNPRSKTPPVEYSVYEEARGGGHAAYARTVRHAETVLLRQGVEILRSELK